MYVEKYNRQKTIEYAKKWAYGRNNKYYNFDNIGGDCTNFIHILLLFHLVSPIVLQSLLFPFVLAIFFHFPLQYLKRHHGQEWNFCIIF